MPKPINDHALEIEDASVAALVTIQKQFELRDRAIIAMNKAIERGDAKDAEWWAICAAESGRSATFWVRSFYYDRMSLEKQWRKEYDKEWNENHPEAAAAINSMLNSKPKFPTGNNAVSGIDDIN